jgi:hypothetical protein
LKLYAKYLVPLCTVIGAALSAYHPQIQALIMAHPAYAGVLAAVTTLVAYYTQSPLASKSPEPPQGA